MADCNRDDEDSLIRHSFDKETPASIAVIQAIAAIENVDPAETPEKIGFTLFDHVDPEALDTIVADQSDKTELLVELPTEDNWIEISSTGRIRVYLE